MAARVRKGFRFDPPPVEPTPALEWTLSRAFGPLPDPPTPFAGSAAAFETASRLGLSPRIAARAGSRRLAVELGDGPARRFSAARASVLALELAEDRALELVGETASELGLPYALLKGKAIARSGRSPAGARPGSDLDLLVPDRSLARFQQRLLERGFAPAGGRSWEHQAPVLRHPEGAAVELHRSLPGVRVDGRRSARFEDLERSRLLDRWCGAGAPPGEAFLPVTRLLAAHALVHALAQHGLSAGYPGFWLVADLCDLGATGEGEPEEAAAVAGWIARDVAREEVAAARELSAALALEGKPFAELAGNPRRLAEHFVACAFDAAYAVELRARQFEAPLSDLPAPVARGLALWRALVPPRERDADGPTEPMSHFARRLLTRPWDLGRRWRAARAAARKRQGRAAPGPGSR